jgi:hypothetical protein
MLGWEWFLRDVMYVALSRGRKEKGSYKCGMKYTSCMELPFYRWKIYSELQFMVTLLW